MSQRNIDGVPGQAAFSASGLADDPRGAKREHEDIVEAGSDSDDDDERPKGAKRTSMGRRKIRIEYIEDKNRRHITFSKRKAGIMKKAYELSTLTGTQVLLLVVSETGLVYTFTTPKLQPLVTKPEGKNLIQACLNAPDPASSSMSMSSQQQDRSPPSRQAGAYGSAEAGDSLYNAAAAQDDRRQQVQPPPAQMPQQGSAPPSSTYLSSMGSYAHAGYAPMPGMPANVAQQYLSSAQYPPYPASSAQPSLYGQGTGQYPPSHTYWGVESNGAQKK
ncbi:uncharacterized protein VTP21DRAFT_5843 [Calcarisporiella thermophila]|uniref:uncharacterized protein n=1 Tax=Calcarisporiella thermophila TaxID=911321 RepID=UPI003743B38E